MFAALGDPTRLALLRTLSDGARRSISALSADTDLTRQAVTKHLHVLQAAGLVTSERVGRESRFTFEPVPIEQARDYLDHVSAQWDDALGRLKAFVEKG
ncbi:MAG TPA: metalloregulator ArsR/SmtB family transcription factor [Caulobacteraceae bacterium]|nr:metalloregulator ArsR/SmtB family transcription factor [Caulobacteraceae bacterium]